MYSLGKQTFLNNSDFNKLQIGFKKYDELFLGNIVTYHYSKNGQSQCISVAFRKQNFKHLSGCCLKNKKSANSFYNMLKKNRIERTDIYYQSEYAKAKLQILPSLDLLLTQDVQITEGNGSINLQFDNMIKSNKQIIGLACIIGNGLYSKPVSLLNMKLDSPIKNAKLTKYPVIDIDIRPINNNIKK